MAAWTPANLATPFKAIVDSRNVVWSGSNLSSLANDGSVGGSWAASRGTMTKGTVINGITPIANDGTKGLKLTSFTTTTTKLFAFWVLKIGTGRNTLFGHEWAGGGGGTVLYVRDSEQTNHLKWYTTGTGSTQTAPDIGTSFTLGFDAAEASGIADTIRYNGVVATVENDANPEAMSARSLYFGESGVAYGPEGIVGDVFYAAFSDSIPTSDELLRLEGWASWAFAGDGSLLPVGHAYALAPPTTTDSIAIPGVVVPIATTTVLTTGSGSFTFTSPGALILQGWGAGASGTASAATAWVSGSGGAYSENGRILIPINANDILYYNVGAGGAATTATTGNAGGDTWAQVNTNAAPTLTTKGIVAKGAAASTNAAVGAAGASASGVGINKFSGGAGRRITTTGGVGGGSSAGTATGGSNNTTSAGATAPAGGGNGGAGAASTSVAGSPGLQPGGGGGNSQSASFASGAGGAGKLIYTFIPVPSYHPFMRSSVYKKR